MLHTRSPLLFCALLALTASGCKKSTQPAPPAREAAEARETPSSLWTAALQEALVTLPVVPGALAADPPVAPDSGEPRWESPTVLVGAGGVFVDGRRVMSLICPDGPATCEAPAGAPKKAWRPLSDAVAASGGSVTTMAVDRALPYEVMAFAVGAATASGQSARLLVSARGEALGAVPLGGSPSLRQKRLDSLALARFVDTQEIGKQVENAGLPRDMMPEPPRAAGQLVRVTTGQLVVPEACGGTAAATALRRGIGGYRSCYREALLRNQKTAGEVSLALRLGAEGRVTDAKMGKDTTGDAQLASCLQAEVAKVQLPTHGAKEACETTLTLKLRTEAQALGEPEIEIAKRLVVPTPPDAPLSVVVDADGLRLHLAGQPPKELPAPTDRQGLVAALRTGGAGAREVELTATGAVPAERVAELARAAIEAGANNVMLVAPR